MNKQKLITILCILEGFKTAIKNNHWATDTKSNKHKVLDTVSDLLADFSDAFAEESIILFGRINDGEIVGRKIPYDDGYQLLKGLEQLAIKIKKNLNAITDDYEAAAFAGLSSLVDEFIHAMHINMYRYKMD